MFKSEVWWFHEWDTCELLKIFFQVCESVRVRGVWLKLGGKRVKLWIVWCKVRIQLFINLFSFYSNGCLWLGDLCLLLANLCYLSLEFDLEFIKGEIRVTLWSQILNECEYVYGYMYVVWCSMLLNWVILFVCSLMLWTIDVYGMDEH